MKILELNTTEYILHDDLEEEDLICLLDLLRDVRNGYTGELIDVQVGYKQPRRIPAQKEDQPS